MVSEPVFHVRIPATSANLGPGFDCMGVALELYNDFVVEMNQPFGIHILGESAAILPKTRDNVVAQTMDQLFQKTGAVEVPDDWRLTLVNRIAVASGLGSSAAAIVGGLLLANAMVAHYAPKKALSQADLLDVAIGLEGHPDNVAPAMLGGACISCVDGEDYRQLSLPVPSSLYFVVAVPYFSLFTEQSRTVVPKTVALGDAVSNIAQAARLVLAFSTNQLDLLRGGFVDKLHEPYRSSLIPGCVEVRETAVKAGAITTTLSGAGPSLLAWCDSERTAWQVADQMTLAWREHNVPCRTEVYRAHHGEVKVQSLTKVPYFGEL